METMFKIRQITSLKYMTPGYKKKSKNKLKASYVILLGVRLKLVY